MSDTERPTLSVAKTADLLGISRLVVQQATHDGSLPSVRVGRRIFIPHSRLLAWLDGRQVFRAPGPRPGRGPHRRPGADGPGVPHPTRQLTSDGRPQPGCFHMWSADSPGLPAPAPDDSTADRRSDMAIQREVIAPPGNPRAALDLWSQSEHATAYDQLLSDAVSALSAAARLTWTERWPDGTASTRPCDWAEFVSLAMAGAAANIGSIETVLAGRPGSWEADAVRTLLTATVGHDEQQLLGHRTEPVVVNINVDDMMVDLGAWQAYDDACDTLQRRYDDLDLPEIRRTAGSALDFLARLAAATPEQENRCEQIAELEDRLEQQRHQDWVAYGAALVTHIQAEVIQIEGLRVPVVVNVDIDPVPATSPTGTWGRGMGESIPERLLHAAVDATPLPGHGRSPLERLEQAG